MPIIISHLHEIVQISINNRAEMLFNSTPHMLCGALWMGFKRCLRYNMHHEAWNIFQEKLSCLLERTCKMYDMHIGRHWYMNTTYNVLCLFQWDHSIPSLIMHCMAAGTGYNACYWISWKDTNYNTSDWGRCSTASERIKRLWRMVREYCFSEFSQDTAWPARKEPKL